MFFIMKSDNRLRQVKKLFKIVDRNIYLHHSRQETDLSDGIDELGWLRLVAADTPPVLLALGQLGMAGSDWDEVAGVGGALRAADAAEHGAQLGGVNTAGTRADEILCLG